MPNSSTYSFSTVSSLSDVPESITSPVSTEIEPSDAPQSRKRKINAVSPPRTSKRRRSGVAADPDVKSESVTPRNRSISPPRLRRRVKQETTVRTEAEVTEKISGAKRTTRGKKVEAVVREEEVILEEEEAPSSQKRKRTTKKKVEEMIAPLAPRTLGSKLFIGAHVSAAGGVHNAIPNANHIGANSFALFLKNQRRWGDPPLDPSIPPLFTAACADHTYDPGAHVVPHGSYLVNLAHPDPARAAQAYGSFLGDLVRCRRLGIRLYNFHPGNAAASPDRATAVRHVAGALNRAHADPATGAVVTLLETMTGGPHTLGTRFEDLRDVIALVERKERVGVCLDTCHVFAAGYDLRTPETYAAVMEEFDRVVGREYLMAAHLNDSKAPLGSARDLHANIGTGFLGLRGFWNVINDERFHGIPLVLETPTSVGKRAEEGDSQETKEKPTKAKMAEDKGVWAREIKLLESLHGMELDTPEFKELEARLAARGASERARIEDQVQRRDEKAAQKASGKRKGKKKVETETESSEDDLD